MANRTSSGRLAPVLWPPAAASFKPMSYAATDSGFVRLPRRGSLRAMHAPSAAPTTVPSVDHHHRSASDGDVAAAAVASVVAGKGVHALIQSASVCCVAAGRAHAGGGEAGALSASASTTRLMWYSARRE